MKLKRITVTRLHDLGAFDLDGLAAGLTLVYGPNGSGKTSVMNAVRAVLWGSPKLPHADLVTVWDDGKDPWRAELLGATVGWQRGGADVPPPEVPDAALAASWVVGLLDLLVDAGTRQTLLGRVESEMSGGYDVSGLLAAHAEKRGVGRNERKALQEARSELSRIEDRRTELVAREDGLAELRRQKQDALAAHREAEVLQLVLDLAGLRGDRAVAEGRLKAFAPGIEVATPEAARTLRDWEDELSEARRAANAAAVDRDRAQAAAREAGLEEPVDDADFASAQALARQVRERVRDATQVSREAAAAQAAWDATRRALAPDLDPNGPLEPFPDLDAVQDWAESLLRTRMALTESEGQIQAVQADRDGLGEVPDAVGADALGRAETLLEGAVGKGAEVRLPPWLVVLAVVLGVAGVATALVVSPWLVGLAGLGAGLLVGPYLVPSGGGIGAARARWPEGIDPPRTWDHAGVTAALAGVRERRASIERARILDATLRRLTQAQDRARVELEELGAQRQAVLGGLALDPRPGDLHLADLLRRLGAWRAAGEEAAARTAELEAAEAHLREATRALEAALERLATSGVAADEAEARLDVLAKRSQALRDARRAEAEAGRQHAAAGARIEDLERRIQTRLDGAGVGAAPHDSARLRFDDLVIQHGEWETARDHARQLRNKVAELEARLEDRADLRDLDQAVAEDLLAEARERADGFEEKVRKITITESDLEAERDSQAYEGALAHVAAAEQDLAEVRDGALHDAAARVLLEDVRAAHTERQLPAVFQRARALFSTFTRGRYDLALAGLGGAALELRAVDTAAPGGAGLSLEALSDGTRMQLLLATRVAFATGEEHGRPLPLFLDESLTATDPVRFGAVADAVLALTDEGRQVFYLTSDPADVARWQQACARRGTAEPQVVDLAESRRIGGALDAEALTLPPAPEVPSPDGLDAAEYGRLLNVPRFDPFAGVESIHLFHLLRDDPPLLRRLLEEAQVTRLGPLRRVLALDGAGLLAAGERARMEALGQVAEAYAEAWCEGRGRSVDRAALEASGAVTGAFIKGMSEVAEELGGDAVRLLAALEVPGSRRDDRLKNFRSRYLEQLEAFLGSEGYLDARPRLAPAEVLARCRAAVAEAIGRGVLDAEDVALAVRNLEAATGAR